MQADSIKIEHDEDGFHLIVTVERGHGPQTYDFRVDGEALYDTVKAEIGPWLYERDMAKASMPFRCNPDESGGYDISDPKHPDWHSIHADIWDSREGK